MLAQVAGASASPFSELGPGIGGSTVAVLLLLVVTLLLLRFAYGARSGRARGRLSGSQGPLQVIAQLALSPTQSLYVVRAADRCLLLGGTPSGLALLTELDAAQLARLEAEAAQAAAKDSNLAQRLHARLFKNSASALAPAGPGVQAEGKVP